MSPAMRSNPLVVLCAALGRGHLAPMMCLARELASTRQVSVTLVFQTQGALNSIHPDLFSGLDVEFSVLCKQELNEDPPWMNRRALRLREALVTPQGSLPAADLSVEMSALEQTLRDLLDSPSPPVCVVNDFSQPWAAAPARKLGIPSYVLYTDSASFMAVAYHAEALVRSGSLPVRSSSDKIVVPGLPPLAAVDITNFVWDSTHGYFPMQKLWHDQVLESDGVLLNTFYDLESSAIDALRSEILAAKCPPMFQVGPLICKDSAAGSVFVAEGSAWDDCAAWLDSKRESSVLYVSFGSWEFLPDEQVLELAKGLESSGCDFLWTIKLPPGRAESSLEEMLPEGFREKMEENRRGSIVTSWVPQQAILKHSSIGGFLTHCGWNSVLESVTLAGVPIVCWPFLADQPINCRLLVSGLGIGVEVQEGGEKIVNSVAIEEAIRKALSCEMRASCAKRVQNIAAEVVASGNMITPFLVHLKLN